MFLTEANYYSQEANQEYLSVSQYKDFCGTMKQRGCEARAIAKLRGEWVDEITEATLLGSYIDAHFEGTLNLFKAKHPEIFRKTDAELYAKFQKTNDTIQMLERDEMFMFYMSGEKQVILTAELFGAKWKCKLDSYLRKRAIVDLKYVKDICERFWVKDEGTFVSFVEWWGYDIQAAIYREIEAICSGEERLSVYLAAVDKKKVPNREIVGFAENGTDFAPILYEVEKNVPRILQLKAGKVEPVRCGVCDYCVATKKLTQPVYFRDLIEV
jgi:hypothetical protein